MNWSHKHPSHHLAATTTAITEGIITRNIAKLLESQGHQIPREGINLGSDLIENLGKPELTRETNKKFSILIGNIFQLESSKFKFQIPKKFQNYVIDNKITNIYDFDLFRGKQ